MLSEIAGAIAAHPRNIESIETLGRSREQATRLLEIERPTTSPPWLSDFARCRSSGASRTQPLMAIYGKRVIIIGGGAQVGQVAVGAISEADRHNIRGERISVDTIPLVGEHALADAVRAVARLPRARILVLAGAIMGGTSPPRCASCRGTASSSSR